MENKEKNNEENIKRQLAKERNFYNEKSFNFEVESFRWERQKFILVMTAVITLPMMLSFFIYYENERRSEISLYAAKRTEIIWTRQEENEMIIRNLREELNSLRRELADTQSLLGAVRENQAAQENLLRDLSVKDSQK